MGISESGCSKSITKTDLEAKYKQGFVEGVRAVSDIILELNIADVLDNRGYPCGESNCEPVRLVLDEVLSKLNCN